MDHIAATPLHPEVLDSMLPFLREHYGNPQSLHSSGQESLLAVDRAREQVAELINADAAEIFLRPADQNPIILLSRDFLWLKKTEGTTLLFQLWSISLFFIQSNTLSIWI